MLLFLLFSVSFWVSLSALLLVFFISVHILFFRVRKTHKNASENSSSNCTVVPSDGSKSPSSSNPLVPDEEPEREADAFQSDGDISEENKESPKFFFKFQYQTKTFEEFGRVYKKNEPDISIQSPPLVSANPSSAFPSEEISNSTAEEPQDLSDSELRKKAEVNEELRFISENNNLSHDSVSLGQDGLVNEEAAEMDNKIKLPILEDFGFLSVKDFNALDSDLDSLTSSYEHRSRFMSSTTDGFLSDRDFEAAFDLASSDDDMEEGHKEDEDLQEEYRKLVESQDTANQLEGKGNHVEPESPPDDSHKSSPGDPSAVDPEDSTGLETLWEHQDLVEQLRMELKKARATGLPTIREESEYPKIMEDLKPWKINDTFNHEDRMGELHTFYRTYRERMRKFDVLCYQKMYPIGMLSSKDALQLNTSQKPSSTPAITSLIKQNFGLGKHKKTEESDEMMKYMSGLHGDLEAVYVGQLCLSWEILHWQYGKAIEIWESDSYGIHQYNEVAGEFQQFQVLLQRFIENEPFEGPRVQNYISHRRAGLNFMQVPVIREDRSSQEKKKGRRKRPDVDAITSDELVEIMEESIRILWRFIKGDKDVGGASEKNRRTTGLEPEDVELLAEVQMSLQKKEKKLKEALRGGNCILRRLKKHEEESGNQVVAFLSQVDLRLVRRALSMSKITRDQLVWCSSKVSRIRFVSRKLEVEPSFLLFPCSS